MRPLVAAGMAKKPADRPADAAAFVTALNEVATQAYGRGWYDRGRSHLAESVLLLAALWPSGGPAAIQGSAVQGIPLRQRIWRHRPRRLGGAIAAAIVIAIAGTFLGIRLTTGSSPASLSQPVTLPAVTGVSPASGSTVGGSRVTITGTGLAGATVVHFGRVGGTIISDSGTQLVVTSPPSTGTPGTGTQGTGTPGTGT